MSLLKLHDDRSDCLSIIAQVPVSEYISLIQNVYHQKGGIKGQRSKLTTTSARRIRGRMQDDIKRGAIFPPIVIGWIAEKPVFELLSKTSDVDELWKIIDPNSLSIIDGMQRTTAILDAIEEDAAVREKIIRVEFWVSTNQDALIYRMLVLNAGQIPWDIKKQITVIFEPIIEKVKASTEVSRVVGVGGERRFNPGEYGANDISELYIAFGSRKLSIDTQEVLADEFAKLDIVATISENINDNLFYAVLDCMVLMDRAFSRYHRPTDERTNTGRKIFDKQTARVGFITAAAVSVFGRAGSERSVDQRKSSLNRFESGVNQFCATLNAMENAELGAFLQYDILEEMLSRKSSQVGRYERNLFFEGFKTLAEQNFNVSSMEVVWRAAL